MFSKHERFVEAYLRLNGYFTVPNFIIHAADDPARILNGHVGNHTESDVLAIRMPYSIERTGGLTIENDPALVSGDTGRIDVIIGEVKSGKSTKPNKVWIDPSNPAPIEYIIRFVGLFKDDSQVQTVSAKLLTDYRFEDSSHRIRHVLFGRIPNRHYQEKGIQFITYKEMARFLIEHRQCWVENRIGSASTHDQWEPLLKDVFAIVNDRNTSNEIREELILAYLDKEQ